MKKIGEKTGFLPWNGLLMTRWSFEKLNTWFSNLEHLGSFSWWSEFFSCVYMWDCVKMNEKCMKNWWCTMSFMSLPKILSPNSSPKCSCWSMWENIPLIPTRTHPLIVLILLSLVMTAASWGWWHLGNLYHFLRIFLVWHSLLCLSWDSVHTSCYAHQISTKLITSINQNILSTT